MTDILIINLCQILSLFSFNLHISIDRKMVLLLYLESANHLHLIYYLIKDRVGLVFPLFYDLAALGTPHFANKQEQPERKIE